jgi:hypothetical protein
VTGSLGARPVNSGVRPQTPSHHATGVDGVWETGDNNSMSTIITPSPALASRFHTLADEWYAATRLLASPTAATEHPAYRAIVALGPDVVPLLLAALAASPEPWFAALRELTGADPVPAADRGRPRAAAAHWLAWGRAHGLA